MSASATALLTNPTNDLHLSMASAWEIAIKSGMKKLVLSTPFTTFIGKAIVSYQISLLPITIDDCIAYEQLPFPTATHRDPFDRMIISHALRHGMSIVGNDLAFDAYGVSRLW